MFQYYHVPDSKAIRCYVAGILLFITYGLYAAKSK